MTDTTGKRTKKSKATSEGKSTRGTKVKATPKLTSLERDLAPVLGLALNGTVLAIDPSSGSTLSQPGYAIFVNGRLKDSGLVRIRSGDHISNRLYRLSKTLREEFEQPTLLVTENIPPFMGDGPGAQFATRNVISLHQSIGVVMSVWDVPVIQVSPRTWRSRIPDNYLKSDENDAIMIGWSALQTARKLAQIEEEELSPELIRKLTTGSWD